MSIVGLICHAAGTMGEAFEQMNRFARLTVEVDGHQAAPRFALVRSGGDVWLEDQRHNPNDFPELTESTIARFITDTARHFGTAPFARAVHVTHAAPAHHADYARLLGVPVQFSSDRNSILIHESWLSIPLHNPNCYVFGILSEHAARLLAELEATNSIAAKVDAILIPSLHSGEVSIGRVAQSLGVSRTTLFRQLKREGTSFAAQLDALRHSMALHYLRGGRVSINETAYLVGYADPAAFSRAFKRWTGVSPRAALIQSSPSRPRLECPTAKRPELPPRP